MRVRVLRRGARMCAYAHVCRQFNIVCWPHGRSSSCLPGCANFAHPEGELGAMLEEFVALRDYVRGYNEVCASNAASLSTSGIDRSSVRAVRGKVIVSSAVWSDSLPRSFVAFFYPSTPACHDDGDCEARTRRAHAAFLRDFPASDVPLLTLDPANWNEPFAVAPASTLV